jgi:hypothetical protein
MSLKTSVKLTSKFSKMYSSKITHLTTVLFAASCKIIFPPLFLLVLTKSLPLSLACAVLTGPWSNLTCTDPAYIDQTINASTRWDYAHATEAWDAAIAVWQPNPYPYGFNFSQFMANSFGSPSDVECSVIGGSSSCDQYAGCVVLPAYDAIQRSFAWLHDVRFPMLFY